jgi:FPC/CPF motif-containing protein YcgG
MGHTHFNTLRHLINANSATFVCIPGNETIAKHYLQASFMSILNVLINIIGRSRIHHVDYNLY